MAKKAYSSPLVIYLQEDEDPTIIVPVSQGSSGYDSTYTFEGIDQDILDLIELNCDDFDLQAMDTDGNFKITLVEFQTWFDENQPW